MDDIGTECQIVPGRQSHKVSSATVGGGYIRPGQFRTLSVKTKRTIVGGARCRCICTLQSSYFNDIDPEGNNLQGVARALPGEKYAAGIFY